MRRGGNTLDVESRPEPIARNREIRRDASPPGAPSVGLEPEEEGEQSTYGNSAVEGRYAPSREEEARTPEEVGPSAGEQTAEEPQPTEEPAGESTGALAAAPPAEAPPEGAKPEEESEEASAEEGAEELDAAAEALEEEPAEAEPTEELPPEEEAPAGGGSGGPVAGDSQAKLAAAYGTLSTAAAGVSAIGTTRAAFVGKPKEKQEQARERALSEGLLSEFLARNAYHAASFVATGISGVPRILAAAETAKAAIDVAVVANVSALQGQIAADRARVMGEAEAALAEISGARDAALVVVTALGGATRLAVEAGHLGVTTTLATLESEQVTAVGNLYAEWDPKYRAVGTEVGNEAVSQAEGSAQRWLAQRNGESSVLDGPIHDDRLEARAKAARDVAGEYKKSLVEEAGKQADKIWEGQPAVLTAVADAATQARDAITQHKDSLIEAITSAEEGARSGIEALGSQMLDAVAQSRDSSLASLDSQGASKTASIVAAGEGLKGTIDQQAADAATALVEGAAEAASSFEQALRGLIDGAAAADAPEPGALSAVLAEVQAQTDALAQGALAQMEAAVASAEQGIQEGGATAVSTLDSTGQGAVAESAATGDGFSTSLAGMRSQATEGLAQLQEGFATTSTSVMTAAAEGYAQTEAALRQTFTTISINSTANFTHGSGELRTGLRGALTDLDAKITEFADKAAADVQPRWKRIAKILLVVIVVALVIVLTIVSAGSLGVLGTIALGVALGAASGAAIQIGNNLIDGKTWHEGVAQAAAIGAISGLFGGIGGAAAKGIGGALAAGAGRAVLSVGVELGFDAVGSVIGDLIFGNPITVESVLIGAAIGVGVSGGLGGLKALRNKIKIRVRPDVNVPPPTVRPHVDAPAPARPPVEAAPPPPRTAAPETPVTPRTPAPEPPPPRRPATPETPPPPRPSDASPAPKPVAEAPTTPRPDAETPVTPRPGAEAPTAPRPDAEAPTTPRPDADAPVTPKPGAEVEAGVVAKHQAPDGHEFKVTKNGDIIRCTDCELVGATYKNVLDNRPNLKKKYDQIAQDLQSPDPTVRARAGEQLEDLHKKLFIENYRLKVPAGTLSDKELRDYYKRGFKLDPDTKRMGLANEPLPAVPRPDLNPTPQQIKQWDDHQIGNPNTVPCFPAGTLVWTDGGPRRIETMAAGDRVWTYSSGVVALAPVARVLASATDAMVKVTTDAGEVEATRRHPFWVESRGEWLRAAALHEGDTLRMRDGSIPRVLAVAVRRTLEDTFNLEVPGPHNYFAGDAGFLVHNDELESGFENVAEAHKYDFYEIRHKGKVIYVGRTYQAAGPEGRFRDHRDPSSPLGKKLKALGINPDALVVTKVAGTPTRSLTQLEAAVWEQHLIDKNGGKSNLLNARNEITPEKFERYRKLHNACA